MFAPSGNAKVLAAASICCALLGAFAGRAQADSSFMPLGRATMAPHGFLQFCQAQPQQCRMGQGTAARDTEKQLMQKQWAQLFGLPNGSYQPASTSSEGSAPISPSPSAPGAPLRLDNRLLEQLTLVNARVNAAITPMSDTMAFGANDVWTLPIENGGPARGNCKHYALEKQRALIAAGLPVADLSLAVVRTPWGKMHAVLLVSTDRGEVVLDNLAAAVLSWRDADYTWLERQKPGEPLTWVTLATAGDPTRR